MSSLPTTNEAYAAAEAFCDSVGIDTTTDDEGERLRTMFAAGWLTGVIRGSDAATQVIMDEVRRVFGQ
jgi:hypothetical protein